MKKLMIVAPLAAAICLTSCIKLTNENVFKNDATATMKMTMGYKLDAVEALKAMIDQFGGGEEEDGPGAKIDEALAEFDEKKIAEHFKKAGIEVTKSSASEKDGWKMVEVEGSVKNVNEWVKKSAASVKEQAGGEGMDAAGTEMLGRLVPRFYKTDKADVAKFVVVPPLGNMLDNLGGGGLPDLDEMDDEMREQVETQINQFRGMFSIDEMRAEMKMKVPGRILTVKGAKQDGENGFIFTLKGSDIGLDSLKDMMGLKDGVYATFQFDPKEFKIELEDEAKTAESKPAKKEDAPRKEKKDEEEKKGGGDGG